MQPTHKLVQQPFKITSADFDNWIQERGIYFAGARDTQFVSLFAMADPKEQANDGALVYATYGKGSYICTGLVFFRELPAGNLGAYKFFINLLYNP
ncbi:MAG: hypothetical protein KF882_02940 [Bacteroidia bacterium]|nr:hypothetical protein [Bacteroidia bacterium]MCO5253759.1 hypothetical protein [Bacteroidota bacterium]